MSRRRRARTASARKGTRASRRRTSAKTADGAGQAPEVAVTDYARALAEKDARIAELAG